MSDPAPISTHVLDTVRGEPAAGVPVRLEREQGGSWSVVAEGVTDADGRLREFAPAHAWRAVGYRLVFDVRSYLGDDAFFPEIAVAFQVRDPGRHHHVPLLLSRFGYTTYRGS
jgi:5-hydroxyisourate hydrolase